VSAAALGIDYSIADLSDPEAAAKIDAWIKEVTNGGSIFGANHITFGGVYTRKP
jgi:hypothetical protein